MADIDTGSATIEVRAVTADDHAEWLRLFRDYITFYEEDVPEDVIATTWRRLLAQEDNMIALIAIANGRALGIANLVFHRSTWARDWYCYLEDLFVAPGARGKGVGRALIEAVYAEADRLLQRCGRRLLGLVVDARLGAGRARGAERRGRDRGREPQREHGMPRHGSLSPVGGRLCASERPRGAGRG